MARSSVRATPLASVQTVGEAKKDWLPFSCIASRVACVRHISDGLSSGQKRKAKKHRQEE